MRNYKVYVPNIAPSGTLESLQRNLTWVAGGRSDYKIEGSWHDKTDGMNIVVEDVTVQQYFIAEGTQELTFRAGLDLLIDELHRLGEKSVLWTVSEEEVHFD